MKIFELYKNKRLLDLKNIKTLTTYELENILGLIKEYEKIKSVRDTHENYKKIIENELNKRIRT
jgi:hypothetical protein